MELPFAESWKIKMVEPIRKSTRAEREQWIKEANYNVFQLKADQVYIDGLTDSGTGAMSDRQWAALMMGDESYAGARSFYELKDTITRITGFEYVIPTHQGRAAENVLFSALVKEGDVVPGNSHFDTTKGHIESRRAMALDCTVDEAKNTQLEVPFKGNVDPKKLEKALELGGYAENKAFTGIRERILHQDPRGGLCRQDHQGNLPRNVCPRRRNDHVGQKRRPREHGRFHRYALGRLV